MNIFLVGNGFDLHHHFPTNYLDFLHTVQFLIEHSDISFDTVGKIFGNSELRNRNSFINKCYEKHARIYDSTLLPKPIAEEIVAKAQANLWFNYLRQCISKDMHWIDFEKEILRVLEAFSEFFDYKGELSLENNQIVFDFASFPSNPEDRHILSCFDYPFEELEESRIGRSRMMRIKSNYTIEKVVGSGSYHLAIDDIVSDLYSALRELADVLRLYLLYFVDAPAKEYAKLDGKPHWPSLPTPNYVYSFNYTGTIEILHSSNMVDHIHGSTNTELVLGVNPDEADELGNTDTTFLQFKKYFQRVFFKTDLSFINKIRATHATPRANDTTLYVLGHSLDSTDEDIIKQIFDVAKSIIILYHSESSVKNQIKNLVKIYGKSGLDTLREQKKLQFLPQSDIVWTFPQ